MAEFTMLSVLLVAYCLRTFFNGFPLENGSEFRDKRPDVRFDPFLCNLFIKLCTDLYL